MVINKKGFMFTIISVVLLTLLYIMMMGNFALERSQQSVFVGGEKSAASLIAEGFMSAYLDDILAASAYNVLLAFTEELSLAEPDAVFEDVLVDGLFSNATHFRHYFIEAMTNATINGQEWSRVEGDDLESIFSDIRDTSASSGLFSVNMAVVENTTSLYHNSPWSVRIHSTILVDFEGQQVDIVQMHFRPQIEISILNFTDPYLFVYSNGSVNQTITMSNRTFGAGGGFDVTQLIEHLAEQPSYIPRNNAPSFLQRFTHDAGPNKHGIESLLQPDIVNALVDAEFINDPEKRSFAAHAFFSKSIFCDHVDPGSIGSPHLNNTYNISGMPSDFHLDTNSTRFYTGHPSGDVMPPGLFTRVCP